MHVDDYYIVIYVAAVKRQLLLIIWQSLVLQCSTSATLPHQAVLAAAARCQL
jgi:hypothetical protein